MMRLTVMVTGAGVGLLMVHHSNRCSVRRKESGGVAACCAQQHRALTVITVARTHITDTLQLMLYSHLE
jgi:hypothetical protein